MQRHETDIQMVLAPSKEVYAATDVPLQVKVCCAEQCDLQGGQVRISNENGDVVQDVKLALFDGQANTTDEFIVKMPVEPGSYTWTALFMPHESKEIEHQSSSVIFDLVVKPHKILISVWGIPSPVIKGQQFLIKVGAKCSAGCSVAGLPYVIENAEHGQVASGKLGDQILPQTSNTYWSEQELDAPPEEGIYRWTAGFETSRLELRHETSPKQFTFYADNPPEHVVTIEVVDKSRNIPVKGASIFLRPRRTSSDEHGIAEIQAAEGEYQLYVSCDHYVPFQATVQVTGNIVIKAELIYNPDPYAI